MGGPWAVHTAPQHPRARGTLSRNPLCLYALEMLLKARSLASSHSGLTKPREVRQLLPPFDKCEDDHPKPEVNSEGVKT